MNNDPTLFDAFDNEPEPQKPEIDHKAAFSAAAAAYRAARPELCRNRVFYGPQETSRKAADRALPKTGTKRHEIWLLIQKHGGLTADEINEITGISPNTINPTIRGLVLDGWLEDCGERRNTRTGNEAIVWQHKP